MSTALDLARRQSIITAFRTQADFCRARDSSFTAAIVDAVGELLAENNEDRWALCEGLEGDPVKGAVALRFAGALHALVLNNRAGPLSAYYQAPDKIPNIAVLRDAIAPLLKSECELFIDYVKGPPQTNEVNRAAVLLLGFSEIARQTSMPLDLQELGASAGLLLCWDRFRYDYGDLQWGNGEAAIKSVLDDGLKPELQDNIEVANRRGCDLNPSDLSDPATRLRMKSYIWPEQPERLALFERAAAVALDVKPQVEKADAIEWLREQLKTRKEGRVTVVYHSVFAPYLSEAETAALAEAVESAGRQATSSAPLAYLRFEPVDMDGDMQFYLDLRLWPGGDDRRLARAHPHGAWVEPMDNN